MQRRTAGHAFTSLESKLPVLIGGLVALALLTILLLVRYELRSTAVEAAGERLQRVSTELTSLFNTSLADRAQRYAAVAARPEVVAYATGRSEDVEAVTAALNTLRSTQDGELPIDLRAVDGSVRVRAGVSPEVPGEGVSLQPELGDSIRWTPLAPQGERLGYWVSAPVRSDGRIVGYIAQRRALGGAAALQRFEQLIGGDIDLTLRVANAGQAQVFSFADGARIDIERPPIPDSVLVYDAADAHRHLAYATAIGRTPWLLLVEMPEDLVTARSDAVMRRLGLVGLFVLLLGLLGAWAVSRSVTRPLATLGAAADAIAAGDYSRRTELHRQDEIGHLAERFDDMARHVGETHEELERRYEHAQSLAVELELANAALQESMTEAETARYEAQQASTAKSQFLATMSHEIRTPINAIIGYTDLMDLELPGPLTAQQQDYVRRIRISGEHLISVINEVLDFAKIESGQMRVAREPGSVRAVVETVISMLHARAEEKGIEIRGEIPDEELFLGDAQRVQQVLVNLIGNALKFTPEGGSVRVVCERRQSRPASGEPGAAPAQWTCISVSDNGIGIGADQLETIFDPFVQGAAGYTRPHGGTGLGLAISRSLARMMDGDLTVESEPGLGSTFTLWLPAPSHVPVGAS